VYRGWRLLTDELTLIDTETLSVIPIARPISLKNESIGVIQRFAREAVFGPLSPNTVKGTIRHVRPPPESVVRLNQPSKLAWCVFPSFRAQGGLTARGAPRGQAFMRIAASSVNYAMLGERGFSALSEIMDGLKCHDFEYSDLKEAVGWFNELN
jgi:hypothetical protein